MAKIEALAKELHQKCEVIEPRHEEVCLIAREAIALERLVKENKLRATAIETGSGLIRYTGVTPCEGIANLIDQGIVVTTEGDMNAAVSGLILRELTGKPIHFWEYLGFDKEKNGILGGREEGPAGFTMGKANTQSVNFEGILGALCHGMTP